MPATSQPAGVATAINPRRKARISLSLPIPQLLGSAAGYHGGDHGSRGDGRGRSRRRPRALADSSGGSLPGSGQCEAAPSRPGDAGEPMPLKLARSEFEAQPGCSAPDARLRQRSSSAEMEELRTLPNFGKAMI